MGQKWVIHLEREAIYPAQCLAVPDNLISHFIGITYDQWEMAVVTVLAVVFSTFVYFTLLGLLGELAVKASGMHDRSTLDRILNELHG